MEKRTFWQFLAKEWKENPARLIATSSLALAAGYLFDEILYDLWMGGK